TPIDVENGQATSSGATHSTPSITTSVANTMLVASFGLAGTGTWTPPAGMTERSDSTAQAVALEVADVLQVSAGASGTKTATASANYAHTYQGSDPALLAGGKISMISSGASAGRTSTSITGIVYTFAGSDNPDGNGNLQGASSGNLGFDLQHGADSIAFTLS